MSLGLQPGLHLGISERDYHSDNLCDGITLSCSLAKTLIDKAPIHAWSEHPRLGNRRDSEPTPEMDFGSAAHALCLGKGAKLAVCESDDWRKKEAKEFRLSARAAGHIPILQHRLEEAEQQRTALHERLKQFGLLEQFEAASPEVVMIYDDGSVRCRAMLDKVLIDEAAKRAVIFDLKTTDSANPKGLGRLVFNQHYDMQDASYTHGFGLVRPDLAGRVDFIFLFLETTFPFCLTPYRLSGEQRTLGMSKWSRAWQTWDACTKSSAPWPAYTKKIVDGEAPEWALTSEIGANPILP